VKIVDPIFKRYRWNKVDQDFGHRYIAMLWFDVQQTFFELTIPTIQEVLLLHFLYRVFKLITIDWFEIL